MKNFFLGTSLVFLIVLGVAAGWVIVDPAGVKSTLGLLEEEAEEPSPLVSIDKPKTRRVPPRSEMAQADTGTVDRKAQRARRPPTRAESDAAAADGDAETVTYRRARYVGPRKQPLTSAPPAEELYPFSINKRTFPDADTISVELLIKNRSGNYWKTAYVVLRPLDGKKAETFQIDDWNSDETAAFDYAFPKSEIRERMSKLRIMSVTGEMRVAALARKLSETREKGAALSKELMATYTSDSSSPGQIEAPGLLGALAWATSPVTGIEVEMAQMEDAEAPLSINYPQDRLIPEIHPVEMATSSAERNNAMLNFEDAHKAAGDVEDTLRDIADEMERLGYTKARDTTTGPMLEKVRRDLGEFNRAALKLATTASRTTDREIKELDKLVGRYGGVLVDLMEQMEEKVFSVQN